MQSRNFVIELSSGNADVRFGAWRAAGEMAVGQVGEVAKLMSSASPGIVKSAGEALTTLAHSVGKEAGTARRAEVVKALMGLTGAAWPAAVRVHAMRLLSGIAGEGEVGAIAAQLAEAGMREEAIYALERIPGEASMKAVMGAYAGAAEEFKPRLLAALGHRRVAAAAGLCAEAMRSQNREIAAAGLKAAARIGRAPVPAVAEGPERADAVLRFAEAQMKQGNAGEALRLYRSLLEDAAAHVQAAAVIGLSKLKTAEAAALILPKTKSENRTVRVTAQKAWKAMA